VAFSLIANSLVIQKVGNPIFGVCSFQSVTTGSAEASSQRNNADDSGDNDILVPSEKSTFPLPAPTYQRHSAFQDLSCTGELCCVGVPHSTTTSQQPLASGPTGQSEFVRVPVMKPLSENQPVMEPQDGCYAIVPESDVAARVELNENGTTRILNGQVRVLSRSQLRLTITEELPVGTPVQLEVDVESMGVVFSSAATVRWTQVRGDGRSWMSCDLKDQISESLMEQLAVQGHVDRREASRAHLSQSVTVRRELGKGTISAKIANLSPTGRCLLTAEPV
jgi:hypothetical protein